MIQENLNETTFITMRPLPCSFYVDKKTTKKTTLKVKVSDVFVRRMTELDLAFLAERGAEQMAACILPSTEYQDSRCPGQDLGDISHDPTQRFVFAEDSTIPQPVI